MPEHRIPRATLHEDLQSVQREGEHVYSILEDPDPNFVRVITRYSTELQTRPEDTTGIETR
jgi:hypothetical protein